MPETVIPGTYITVRSEGLISTGRVATGIIGVVGTAEKGPIGEPITLSSLGEVREIFGLADDFKSPQDGSPPLTLVRAIEQMYNNGASTVVAVRVASDTNKFSSYSLKTGDDKVLTLTAKTPGTWGNTIQIEVDKAKQDCRIEGETHESFKKLNYSGISESPENRIIKGDKPLSVRVLKTDPQAKPQAGGVLVREDGTLVFAEGEEPDKNKGDQLTAYYVVNKENCVQVDLKYGGTIESFVAPDSRLLEKLINSSSYLVNAELVNAESKQENRDNRLSDVKAYFGKGDDNQAGNNGAEAGEKEYSEGLEKLADQEINIVVLAGQDEKKMGSVLLGHVNATKQTDYERIGVIGASGNTVPEILGHNISDDRVILVAPGIKLQDGTKLPAAYTAAAVAGLISSMDVQTSLTNKTLNLPGSLALEFNRGQQEQLIKRNVLTVISKPSIRILKGITTVGEGQPFSAIATRRIVDYAKYGVRAASNPYIGRLNNTRVRSALKSTLDAFLTRMVEDEALTNYQLEVTATRSQEIAGEVKVVMTIQPTFSIDYIRVVINLR